MKEQPLKFLVRLPSDLRDRIAQAAQLYRRSMNSEIVARLEQSLTGLPDGQNEASVEPPFFEYIESTFRRDLSDEEDSLVRVFRRLSQGQKEALLALLGARS